MDKEAATDFHFLSLIAAHQQAGLQQLGKIANPMTGKTERNLEGARYAIEVLESLEKKTRGNLCEEEDRVRHFPWLAQAVESSGQVLAEEAPPCLRQPLQ